MKPPDDDMGEFWRDVRAAKQTKRAENREKSAALLLGEGIPFDVRNHGSHLIVNADHATVDFWPGTGLWRVRNHPIEGRGVRKLIKFVKGNKL